MAEHQSPRPTLTEFFIISQLASLKKGQEVAQGTRERQLVTMVQVLEVAKQYLAHLTATQTAPTPNPSGAPTTWATLKEWLASFVLLHRVWSAWRAISWPVSLGVWGAAAAKWLGLL